MLTREEVERRLEETDYDLGTPSSWPEMPMEACRCSCCGRWLQIVRPGKYQCECENEPEEKYREREALQTALAVMDERDTLRAENERLRAFAQWVAAGEPSPAEYDPSADGRDEALSSGNSGDSELYGVLTVYYNMAQKAKAALQGEGRLLRGALETRVSHCETDGQLKSYCKEDYWCEQCTDADACAALTNAPLIAAEVERVRLLEAVLEAAEAQDPPASANLARALAAYRESECPGGEVCHEKITAREKKGGD